jgi:hypothetical protein
LPDRGNRIFGFLLAAAFGAGLCGSAAAQDRSANWQKLFALVGDYPLGAAVNRTDYESVDSDGRRLYIAKMGGGQLLVFDLDHNKLVAQLDGFPKVTGVLVVPELHKVYASVPGSGVLSSISVGLGMAGLFSGHGEVAVRDTRTLKELARIPAGVFPDGIAYDPRRVCEKNDRQIPEAGREHVRGFGSHDGGCLRQISLSGRQVGSPNPGT